MTMFIPGIRLRQEESQGGDDNQENQQPPENQNQDNQAPPQDNQAPAWSGPSQDEWEQYKQAMRAIAGRMQAPPQQEQEEAEEVDLDVYINQEIERRMAQYRPSIEATVKEQGEKRLAELHDRFEKGFKKPFDRKLAGRLANSFFAELGDPEEAVKQGVVMAIEIREQERTAGKEDYVKSLQKGPMDWEPGPGSGGDRVTKKPTSYEEVFEKWGAETEV
jgi:hypothetical protein